MKCVLDVTKARKLRGEINNQDYSYLFKEELYYELCAIMDRFEDTVVLINDFELPIRKDMFNAFDFIAWLNFADLIYNCLYSLNRLFVVPNNKTLFAYQKTSFYKDIQNNETKYLGKYYTGVSEGTDDDFFKFLRSMVLAHSLSINEPKFEKYTQSTPSFSPLVRWNTNRDTVEISYYAPKANCKHKSIVLEISDLYAYLQSRYDYLDVILDFIKKSKKSERKTKQDQYREAFANIPTDLRAKYDLLWSKYKEFGNIDVKNNADQLSCYLLQSKDLIEYQFTFNSEEVSIFYSLLNAILDIEIKALISQKNNDLVITDFYSGNSFTKEDGVFHSCSYEIEKIVTDYENLLCFGGKQFDDNFEKVADLVKKYVAIDSSMEKREKAYLCVIAYCFDNVLFDAKLSKQLPKELVSKLEKKYEIQI